MKTTTTLRLALWLGAGTLLAPATLPAEPAAQTPAPNPAVTAVQQYLDARAAGQADKAYALLSPSTQQNFPAAQREQIAKQITDPKMRGQMPASLLPIVALFADAHNALHFQYHVTGAMPTDPNVVLVSASQAGTPGGDRVFKIATVPDTTAGGARRIDILKSMDLLDDPAFKGAREKARQASSQSNMKQISLGIIQYTQDHDERFPDADKWVDEVMPYIKTEAVFRDPSAPAGEKWSYTFNKNLSGKSLAALDSPATTVLLFESAAGVKNASDTGASVPKPGRHSGGTDYAFSDGHVKWQMDSAKPSFLLSGK